MSNLLSSSTGISESLLDQINLQEYDVIQGKKYIGSDGKLHTGTLEDRPNDVQCPVVTQYDPNTGFVYLAIPRGAYRKTDGRMSPHPNMKRRLMEIVGEAGFDKGAWSTTINPGGSVTIPKGFHNGSGRVYANPASAQVRVETGRIQWNLGQSPWSKGFGGTIFAAGVTWADEDGGDIKITWSGSTMTVNNGRQDSTPVTFDWICAYYI